MRKEEGESEYLIGERLDEEFLNGVIEMECEEEWGVIEERGYLTGEEFERMQRDGEKAWDEWEASRAKKGGRDQ